MVLLALVLLCAALAVARQRKMRLAKKGQPAQVEVGFTIALGIVVTGFAAYLTNAEETRDRAYLFKQLANSHTANLDDIFNNVGNRDLESLARFCEGSNRVTAEEFEQFVDYLTIDPVVETWAWVPQVPREDLSALQSSLNEDGADVVYGLTENDESTQPDYFYPLVQVQGKGDHTLDRGFDLGSDASFRQKIHEALDTGSPTASVPFSLKDGYISQPGIIIFRPIYSHGRFKRCLVMGVLQLEDALMFSLDERLLHAELIHIDANQQTRQVAATWEGERTGHNNLVAYRPIHAFGQNFMVLAYPNTVFKERYPINSGLSVFVFGLLLTLAGGLVVSQLMRVLSWKTWFSSEPRLSYKPISVLIS